MKTTIQVETIGYFVEDGQEVERSAIPQLNKNRKHVEKPSFSFPFLNLNGKEATNYKNGIVKSFLPNVNSPGLFRRAVKPNIITESRTLCGIANGKELKIRVSRKSGLFFVWRVRKEEDLYDKNEKYEKIMRDFFTKTEKGEDENKIRGMFQAKIPFGRGFWSILYSGEVEAVDASQQHLSFKVTSSATTGFPFWENQSEGYFWKAVFGNIPTIIVGTRTEEKETDPKTREPLCYPELSVYKIERLDRDSIPEKTSLHAAKPRATFSPWSIVDGETRLQEFIKLLNKISEDGKSFVFSRSAKNEKWTISEEDKEEKDEEIRVQIGDIQL